MARIVARALLAAGLLAVALPALAWEKGDWVLARYKQREFWFPGVVEKDVGGTVTVLYDDGDRETLAAAYVKKYDWKVGSRVSCNWKNGGKWYPGKITKLEAGFLSIAYDDGDDEDTTTGLCRSK